MLKSEQDMKEVNCTTICSHFLNKTGINNVLPFFFLLVLPLSFIFKLKNINFVSEE